MSEQEQIYFDNLVAAFNSINAAIRALSALNYPDDPISQKTADDISALTNIADGLCAWIEVYGDDE